MVLLVLIFALTAVAVGCSSTPKVASYEEIMNSSTAMTPEQKVEALVRRLECSYSIEVRPGYSGSMECERLKIAQTLGEMGPAAKDAVPALFHALAYSADYRLQKPYEIKYAKAIISIGGSVLPIIRTKIPPLNDANFSTPFSSWKKRFTDAYIIILGEMGLKGPTAEIISELTEMAIGQLGEPWDSKIATFYLEKILGNSEAEELLKTRKEILRLAQGKEGDSRDTATYQRAFAQLGEIKDKYAVTVLIDCLRYEYWQAPGNAAMALARHKDDPRVVPALISALGYFSRDYAWCRSLHSGVAEALGEIGDKRAIAPLSKMMAENKHEESDPWFYASAAKALAKLGGKDTVGDIINGLRNGEKNWWVRTEIAKVLIDLNGSKDSEIAKEEIDKTIVAFCNMLNNEDSSVRWQAAIALGELGDSKILPALKQRLTIEKDEDVLRKINEAIAKIEKK